MRLADANPGPWNREHDGKRQQNAAAGRHCGDWRRGRLGQQRRDKRPGRCTLPLAGSNGKTDSPPVPADDERRRETDDAVQGIDRANPIEHEREGQPQLRRVAAGGLPVLTGIDPDDDESPRGELALEPLQHGHLRTAFETPARPEVHNDDRSSVLRDRQWPGVERAATERGRRRTGGVVTEVERLEKRCQRRLVGVHRAGQADHEQSTREQSDGEPGGRPCSHRRRAALRHRQRLPMISRISFSRVSL